MFNPKNMLTLLFLSVVLLYASIKLDGMYLQVNDVLEIHLQLAFVQMCSFIVMFFASGMLLLGFGFAVLFTFGGLADWQKEPVEEGWTIDELRQADREERNQHNMDQEQTASAVGLDAVYTDYEGFLRSPFDGTIRGWDKERDQRRVIDGVVASRFELREDGKYYLKQDEME